MKRYENEINKRNSTEKKQCVDMKSKTITSNCRMKFFFSEDEREKKRVKNSKQMQKTLQRQRENG